MVKKLYEEIRNNQILVVVVSNDLYQESIIGITTASAKTYKSICYVSLNRSYEALTKIFSQHKINIKDLFFIDCITKKIKAADNKRVIGVSSPSALTELSIAINKVLENVKTEAIIFDSLSILLIYEEPMNSIKFTHDVMTRIRASGSHGIFTILKSDSNSELMKDLNMFSDKILVL